jgi:hypothetical protein
MDTNSIEYATKKIVEILNIGECDNAERVKFGLLYTLR